MDSKTVPYRYIGEEIDVVFDNPPALEKAPECPSALIWRGETLKVLRLLEEWFDFRRRGKAARNMSPQHAGRASLHGSRGVGRFYFRVIVEDGRIFEIYYDRAPASVDEQKGNWFLLGERKSIRSE